MSWGGLVARFMAFVRAGYPHGVPQSDYIPLLALLRRRLSDDEVAAVAAQLAARDKMAIEDTDIGVAITRITDELPSAADLERVQRRLDAIGWPTDSGGYPIPTPRETRIMLSHSSFRMPATVIATRRACQCWLAGDDLACRRSSAPPTTARV
ncbi:hypothetical protein MUNTM_20870 [Mycobacterium sp. MUNTM1]